MRWHREHEAALGALPSPALRPFGELNTAALTPAPRIGIVPVDRFKPSSELDGAKGTNRAPEVRCKVAASKDFEALQAWLRLRVHGGAHLACLPQGGRARPALGDDGVTHRHYLASNPWDDVPARPDAPLMPQLRALSQKQWALVQAWLDGQAPSPRAEAVSSHAGPRLHDGHAPG